MSVVLVLSDQDAMRLGYVLSTAHRVLYPYNYSEQLGIPALERRIKRAVEAKNEEPAYVIIPVPSEAHAHYVLDELAKCPTLNDLPAYYMLETEDRNNGE